MGWQGLDLPVFGLGQVAVICLRVYSKFLGAIKYGQLYDWLSTLQFLVEDSTP
jgi:hypothetical protein